MLQSTSTLYIKALNSYPTGVLLKVSARLAVLMLCFAPIARGESVGHSSAASSVAQQVTACGRAHALCEVQCCGGQCKKGADRELELDSLSQGRIEANSPCRNACDAALDKCTNSNPTDRCGEFLSRCEGVCDSEGLDDICYEACDRGAEECDHDS